MIVLFSSDQEAEKIIRTLNENKLNVSLLVSETAKSTGRGRKISDNKAVKSAKANKIDVLMPQKLDDDFEAELNSILKNKRLSLGLIFSYGKIIPQQVIDLFKYGIINIHPSLLPKYRGATPIQSTLLNGEDVSGFTIMLVSSGCDCGDILYQEKIKIDKDDNYETLKQKILNRAVEVLPKVITGYIEGEIKPIRQDGSQATQTKKFTKQDGQILPNDSALTAYNKVRAFCCWPKAYFMLNGKRVIIHEAEMENSRLKIRRLQVEGKNIIGFEDFKRGYPRLLTLLPDFVII